MNQAASFGATRPIIPPGTQLNGIYEIDEPIAAGGMGEIYKGHAIQTGDIVAIKLIRSDMAEAEAALALFRKEASALHNLYHEAIVRYYVFTIDPNLNRPYLAMEYVDGQSLSAMLRGGPLAFEAVYRLMQRIAAGLNAAHERGIVHRDVSPDNIIIPAGDMSRAKIIDFGIARSTRLGDDGTVIGSGFAGKYNYVSPEQLGLFGGDVTPRSDIYSLGLVLAEALRHGPVDMGGSHVDVIEKRRSVPDIGPIDSRLRPLIEQMLQPNPDDRPASMAEVAEWVAGPGTTVRHTGLKLRQKSATQFKPKQKLRQEPGTAGPQRAMLIGGGAFAAATLVAIGLYLVLRPSANVAPPAAPVLQADQAPALTNSETPPQALPGEPEVSHVGFGLAAPADIGKLVLGTQPGADIQTLLDQSGDPARRQKISAVTQYINQYDGGDCFFVKPVQVAESGAVLEGYATSAAPFQVMDDAFRRTQGFEADIGVRQVASGECPVVAFLGKLRAHAATAPRLELASATLKSGQPLSGTLTELDGRQVDLLLVADDGSVHAVPTTGEDKLSFSLHPGPELADGKPQFLLAVASTRPVAALHAAKLANADKLLPQILSEAERANQQLSVSAKLFKVDR
ncbi:serine/threonine-protein kinase [Methyloferula stellata]|uniref:serine/threonine-protein kinase n=1 Tax=Methyloferula stellata TaxID=876270 RepID=UPI0003669998|nr:serine/threonine-protein kinase [Methyloferula stellata]